MICAPVCTRVDVLYFQWVICSFAYEIVDTYLLNKIKFFQIIDTFYKYNRKRFNGYIFIFSISLKIIVWYIFGSRRIFKWIILSKRFESVTCSKIIFFYSFFCLIFVFGCGDDGSEVGFDVLDRSRFDFCIN